MAQQNQPNLNWIIKYWQLIVAFAIIVAGFVTMQNSQSYAKEKDTEQDSRISKLEVSVNGIGNDVGIIKNDVSWIRSAMINDRAKK